MAVRTEDYERVLGALRRGRRLTNIDVQEMTGRDALGAQTLLGNLKMGGEARVVGRVGRRALYALGERMAGAKAPSWRSRSAGRAARRVVKPPPDQEALQILLRACRIGPPPVDPPYARVIRPLDVFEPVGGDGGAPDRGLE